MNTTDKTPYTTLYDSCLTKLKSYELAALSDDEIYQIMGDYLRPAIVMYTNCKSDLSDRDDVLGCFNFALSDVEIEVLSKYMLICYLEATYINVPIAMKASLSSKDFNAFSNANLLDKIVKVRDTYLGENKQLSGIMSYQNSELFSLR